MQQGNVSFHQVSYSHVTDMNSSHTQFLTVPNGNLSWQDGQPSVSEYDNQPPGMPFPSETVLALQSLLTTLHFYYCPVLAILGIVGNSICLVVLVDSVLCHLSTTHYLMGICVADSLVLLFQFHQWLTYYNITFYNFGGWCQFVTFVQYVSQFLSTWFTFAYVTDRFIGLCIAHREKKMCTPTRAKIVLIGLMIVAIAVYLNISIMAGLIPYATQVICTTLTKFIETQKRLDIGHVFVNSMLPIIGLIVILLVFVIQRACRGNRGPTGGAVNTGDTGTTTLNYSARRQSHAVNDTQLRVNQTKPFLSILLFYLLMNLPYEGLKFVHTMKALHYRTNLSLEEIIWEQIFLYLKYSKCSLNLLILCSSYASFRKRAKKLPSRLLQKFCKGVNHSEEAESMTSAVALEAGTETTGVISIEAAES